MQKNYYKSKDEKSDLGDYGVRKYDDLTGRFTATDPLWEKYYGWSPYVYSGNDPVNLIDLDGKQPNGIETLFRYGFQDVNASSVENYIQKELPQNAINSVIVGSDITSDLSTYSVLGGAGMIGVGALLSYTGIGASAGVYMISIGTTMMNVGSTVGITSDITNLGAKAVNLRYDGTKEDVVDQGRKIAVNLSSAFITKSIANKFVKLNLSGRFYNPFNGRYVTDRYGNLINAGQAAAADATSVYINYYFENTK